ncbi:MAG: hypothetical protein VX432_03315 [Candidatus Poribacteria bacterium]|nr:hypothetical protein [Candidatus Poribacteria bacterium]
MTPSARFSEENDFDVSLIVEMPGPNLWNLIQRDWVNNEERNPLDVFRIVSLAAVRSLQPGSESINLLCALYCGDFNSIWQCIDQFKKEQKAQCQNPFRLREAQSGAHDATEKSFQQLRGSMYYGDAEGADDAVTKMYRTSSAFELFGMLFNLAIQDFNHSGRKVVTVIQIWKLVQVIGWEYSLPVLRSLARFLCQLPINSDCFIESENLVYDVREDWQLNFLGDVRDCENLVDILTKSGFETALDGTFKAIKDGTQMDLIWKAVLSVAHQTDSNLFLSLCALRSLNQLAYDSTQQLQILFQSVGFVAENCYQNFSYKKTEWNSALLDKLLLQSIRD